MCSNNSFGYYSDGFNYSDRIQHLDALQRETNITMIPSIVFLCLISTTGVIGNSMVLFVYYCKFSRSAVRTFMMAVAVLDLLINTLLIPAEIYDMFHAWDFDEPLVCRVRRFFNAQTTSASGFLLVAIAVTRYRKICRPFDRQVNIREAKRICGVTVLLSTIASVPYGIINGRKTRKSSVPGINGCYCSVDDSYDGTKWPVVNSSFFVLVFLTCCITLFVLYALISKSARRQAKGRRCTIKLKILGDRENVAKPLDGVLTPRMFTSTEVTVENKQQENMDVSGLGCRTHLQQKSFLMNVDKNQSDGPVLLVDEKMINLGQVVSQNDQDPKNDKCNEENSSKKYPRNSNDHQSENEDSTLAILTCRLFRDAQEMTCAVTKEDNGTMRVAAVGESNSWDVGTQPHSAVANTNDTPSDDVEICCAVTESDISSEESSEADEEESSEADEEESSEADEEEPTAQQQQSKARDATLRPSPCGVRQGSSTRRVASARSRTRRRGRRVEATTWMLLTLSIVFFGGFLPFLGLEFFRSAAPDIVASMSAVCQSLYHLFRRSYFLNSAINPIIYNLCDLSFRREFWKICKGR